MKGQGPAGSSWELADMFKQDWVKLRQLACEVSSLPHHLPRMSSPLLPLGSVLGVL